MEAPKMDNISIFSQRFKLLFDEMKVSQQKFTDKYLELYPYDSLSREMVSNYLNGKNLPPMNTIINLSKMLNVSSDFLLGLSDRKEYKDIQYISDTIGLSEDAISTLRYFNDIESKDIFHELDRILSSKLRKELIICLANYFNYRMKKKCEFLEEAKQRLYEYIIQDIESESDEAYNNGIDDAVNCIEKMEKEHEKL